MTDPTIEFDRIRAIHGRQDKGFEEMCCQLAGLDLAPLGSRLDRSGEGPDGGVECFRIHPDGSETGWQAKYVFEMKDTQIRQLDGSLDRALATHPSLNTFIVCIPFDLRDGRRPSVMTERQRYENWRQTREEAARSAGRALDIRLWDRHVLVGLLTREEPAYLGKRLYWFDAAFLTPAWFEARLAGPLADLHDRYQPENHIDVEVSATLRGLVRDSAVLAMPVTWGDRLARAASELQGLTDPPGVDPAALRRLKGCVDALIDSLTRPLDVWDRRLPTELWARLAGNLEAAFEPVLADIWARDADLGREPWRQPLFNLRTAVEAAVEGWTTGPWTLVNSDRLLLWGEAGSGKSHVLAEFAQRRLAAGFPTLLALGGGLSIGDPWRGLLDSWDLPGESVDRFLAALEAAAEASGGPALLIVDGLNEGDGPRVWRGRLAGFLEAVARRPKVVLILSCRSVYLGPLGLGSAIPGLSRLKHPGFDTDDAGSRYLAKRGVHGPGLPELGPELSNPLFLKTCCDLLDRRGETAFPRGVNGVTVMFDIYTEALADTLDARMDLDPLQDIPRRAVRGIAEALSESPGGRIPIDQAVTILDGVLPSLGRRDSSLLHQLVSEGVLSTELGSSVGNGSVVRFTFERFSDHLIARRMLGDLSRAEVEAEVATGALGQRLFGEEGWLWAGVVEALAVQLPERYCLELPDVVPASADDIGVKSAFDASLLWRNPASFSQRTLELIGSEEEQFAVLLHVATEPANTFNADYLHQKLAAMAMPQRDAIWSIMVAAQGLRRGGGTRALIAWGLGGGHGAEPERIRLGATALSWLFTTSHRAVRDRATKALAALLKNRLVLAATLIEHSRGLDDLYVAERVLAAAYGAAIATTDTEQIRSLAAHVWIAFFESGSPPAHLLLRDYAAGIIEYAASRGAPVAGVDLSRLRGPFTSLWPLEAVSEAELEFFDRYVSGGPTWSAILSSCSNHGDFGRYVIEHRTHHWSQRPVADAGLDLETLWERFLAGLEGMSAPAVDAFIAYFNAEIAAAAVIPSWNPSPAERDRATAANEIAQGARAAFEGHLSPEALEDWRTGASRFSRAGFDAERAQFLALEVEPVRRWITKRAYDLGWTPERFESFERSGAVTHDRMTHTVERVGKKYQWLALHEAMARAADNVAPLGDGRREALELYDGAWSTNLRDHDPSMLAASMADDAGEAWWTPVTPRLRGRSAAEAMVWLESEQDLVSAPGMAEVRSSAGMEYVVLHSFVRSRASALRFGSESAEPESWARLDALVVRKEEKDALLAILRGRHWTGSHDLPSYEGEQEAFIGELAWRKPYADWIDWMPGPQGRGRGARASQAAVVPEVRRPSFEYVAERLTYDASLDGDIRAQAPAPWLISAMKLTLTDPRRFVFSNADGRPVFLDPALTEVGQSAALVEKVAFDAMLHREGLDIVWVVAGEKSVYGSDHTGFGGRRVHTTLFDRHEGAMRSARHLTSVAPSPDQLADLFETVDHDDDED